MITPSILKLVTLSMFRHSAGSRVEVARLDLAVKISSLDLTLLALFQSDNQKLTCYFLLAVVSTRAVSL